MTKRAYAFIILDPRKRFRSDRLEWKGPQYAET